ncbi:dihydrofolate reductase [Exophiala viscosa]|uniref:Dihydrofolate reductase n=1 Tax=Exophiala viscosa TaxID=2486360 RepID=A0AAN6E5G5_9EURO|nr:dihydrofolate reductase [Exophiala viscosa]KAI1629473.1 dihydrofolate reductase [Exophiala viscosa]
MNRLRPGYRVLNFASTAPISKVASLPARNLYIMPSAKESDSGMKILMLHGYTQSGALFHAKTRATEKRLQKAFPGISFSYPTGPLRLRPSDVPGFDPASSEDPDSIEAYGWWRRADTADPPEYDGLEDGLQTVAKVLESEGPFDGVIGFSQGAALAAMVASLLEGESRKQAFEKAKSRSPLAISFPASFERLDHPPLKFCAAYCGFRAPGERYRGFYEDPHIQTPVCHFIGSLDSVVEESRTQALVDATGGPEKTQVVTHPGGHFVPSGKPYLDAIAAFIQQKMSSQDQKKDQEERVEDMDVPF